MQGCDGGSWPMAVSTVQYRDSSMLFLTETWQKDTIDNSSIGVTGFSDPVRMDRDPVVTE